MVVLKSFLGEVFPQTLPGPVRYPSSHAPEGSHLPAHVQMVKAANPGTAQIIKPIESEEKSSDGHPCACWVPHVVPDRIIRSSCVSK